jgi:hypothetical protein
MFGVGKIVEVLGNLSRRLGQNIGNVSIPVILLLSLSPNASYLLDQYRYVDPLSYLRGDVTRAEYIGKYRFEYPAISYINENLHPSSKILFIYMGNRGYYCDKEYIFDMNHNRSTVHQFLRESVDPLDILQRFNGMGITHLLICDNMFDRWARNTFTVDEQELLREFFERHVKLLYSKWGYGVYRLEHSFP